MRSNFVSDVRIYTIETKDAYGDQVLFRAQVTGWPQGFFLHRHETVKDAPRSGRANTSHTENSTKVRTLVRSYRCMTMRMIGHKLKSYLLDCS